MINLFKYVSVLLCTLLFIPEIAFAHPGHGQGFLGGIVHPFTGIDHILGMLGMGAWAALRANKKGIWFFVIYLTGLLVGGVIGITFNLHINPDIYIALSIAMTGCFIIRRSDTNWMTQLILTSSFALGHGVAHGMEVPRLAHPTEFILGFLISSSIIFCLGFLFGKKIHTQSQLKRNTGYILFLSAIGLMMES